MKDVPSEHLANILYVVIILLLIDVPILQFSSGSSVQHSSALGQSPFPQNEESIDDNEKCRN